MPFGLYNIKITGCFFSPFMYRQARLGRPRSFCTPIVYKLRLAKESPYDQKIIQFLILKRAGFLSRIGLETIYSRTVTWEDGRHSSSRTLIVLFIPPAL